MRSRVARGLCLLGAAFVLFAAVLTGCKQKGPEGGPQSPTDAPKAVEVDPNAPPPAE